MKKKLVHLMLSLLLALFFAFNSFAATGKITFSDPGVAPGEEVNVSMKVSSSDGNLARADIDLAYDSKLLEFISGTDADGGAGTVRVHGASNGAGTQTLQYNLKFKALSAGKAVINIGNQEVYDMDEQLVNISHEGNSTVSIGATTQAAGALALQSLTVSPGKLEPVFSPEQENYSLSVGTDVAVLAVNALASDASAKVEISGNEGLQMGENTVTITLSSADGGTQRRYVLKVNKQEGGASMADVGEQTETVNEGVRLSAKEKTITIMNPGSDVQIPEGFAESNIDIDGHQVKGWVWSADQTHEYCILYGMNDAGELHFYRYDLAERTIQRYFSDPVEQAMAENAKNYPALQQQYDRMTHTNKLYMIGLIALGLALLFVLILFTVALSHLRSRKSRGRLDGGPERALRSVSQRETEAGVVRRRAGAQTLAQTEAKSGQETSGEAQRAQTGSGLEGLKSELEAEEDELGETRILPSLAAGSSFGTLSAEQPTGEAAEGEAPAAGTEASAGDLEMTEVLHFEELDLDAEETTAGAEAEAPGTARMQTEYQAQAQHQNQVQKTQVSEKTSEVRPGSVSASASAESSVQPAQSLSESVGQRESEVQSVQAGSKASEDIEIEEL